MWLQALSDQTLTRDRLRKVLNRPEYLGLGFSLLCLIAYKAGGDSWLIGTTVTVPPFGLFAYRRLKRHLASRPPKDGVTGLRSPEIIATASDRWLADCAKTQRKMACFAIRMDGFADFLAKHGDSAAQQAQRAVAARIMRALREDDMLTRSGDGEFLLVPTPVRHLDLEICVQMASRIKSAVETALPLDATTVRFTISIGFCRSDQVEDGSFAALAESATLAMNAASRNGSSTIRAYAETLREQEVSHQELCSEAAEALERGQILAWFQPQISTATGEVTGFEALARWNHPERGILGPADFMTTLTNTGQLERLADFMLQQALQAQKIWEHQGYYVPHVGVNFAGEELRNPMLVEKIHWELDRFEVPPNRLAIEVLETVIADTADGAIARNVNGLANLGCYIDLDDFGTGHASISSIRRFAVARLKIDRSFVMQVDNDPEQQKLVAAIVTMADRLGIETLAEGVESEGEQIMLAELGCNHLQGFSIAHPMPLEQTIPWMVDHLSKTRRFSQSHPPQQKGAGT